MPLRAYATDRYRPMRCAGLLDYRLVNVLGSGQWSEDVVPTVAFNLRQVRKGNVTMKIWDVAVSFVCLQRG